MLPRAERIPISIQIGMIQRLLIKRDGMPCSRSIDGPERKMPDVFGKAGRLKRRSTKILRHP